MREILKSMKRSSTIVLALLLSVGSLIGQGVEIPADAEYAYEEAKEYYMSFYHSEFRSIAPNTYEFVAGNAAVSYGTLEPVSASFGYAECALHLPHGAKITELKAWLYDNDPTERIEVQIYEQAHVLASPGTQVGAPEATVEATEGGASPVIKEFTTSTNIDVDNENNKYWLRLVMSGRNDNLRLYSVRIKYEVEQAQ